MESTHPTLTKVGMALLVRVRLLIMMWVLEQRGFDRIYGGVGG